MNAELRELHETLIDLIGLFNEPKRDALLIKEAEISLDRALFPLLVGIERRGPLGIVELAGLAGRDYTTVSRQITKMESLGLVTRRARQSDGRVCEVAVTKKGRSMTNALDAARERLVAPILDQWNERDRIQLNRLLRRFVKDISSRASSGTK